MKKMMMALALVALAGGVAACGSNTASDSHAKAKSSKVVKHKASSKSSSQKAASSSQATPTRQPSAVEQVALVLLASGAEQYSMSGSQLLASGDTETVTQERNGLCDDAPADAQVYGLSLEHENKTPFIVVEGDQAYLFATQSPVPYQFLTTHALKVDLASAWQANFQSADLQKLVGQITVSQKTAAELDDEDSSTENGSAIDVKNLSTEQLLTWVKAAMVERGASADALEDDDQISLRPDFQDGFAEVTVYTWNPAHTLQTLDYVYRVNADGQLEVAGIDGNWEETGTAYPE